MTPANVKRKEEEKRQITSYSIESCIKQNV